MPRRPTTSSCQPSTASIARRIGGRPRPPPPVSLSRSRHRTGEEGHRAGCDHGDHGIGANADKGLLDDRHKTCKPDLHASVQRQRGQDGEPVLHKVSWRKDRQCSEGRDQNWHSGLTVAPRFCATPMMMPPASAPHRLPMITALVAQIRRRRSDGQGRWGGEVRPCHKAERAPGDGDHGEFGGKRKDALRRMPIGPAVTASYVAALVERVVDSDQALQAAAFVGMGTDQQVFRDRQKAELLAPIGPDGGENCARIQRQVHPGQSLKIAAAGGQDVGLLHAPASIIR